MTRQFQSWIDEQEAHSMPLGKYYNEARAMQDIKAEGVKNDQEKARLDLIPSETIQALGAVLTYGAAKYGDHNWLKGMQWHRLFGAAMRHLWAFWSGQDTDEESGLPHLYHSLACISFLITYQARSLGEDDRKKTGSTK